MQRKIIQAILTLSLLVGSPVMAKSIFDGILLNMNTLAIVNPGDKAYVGDTLSYTFNLVNSAGVTLPDSDDTDGSITKLVKAYRITDPSGAVFEEQHEEITSSLSAGGTTSLNPTMLVTEATYSSSSTKKWGMVAVLFSVDQSWDRTTNTWSTGTPVILDQQAVGFDVETPTPPPSEIPGLGSMLSNLWASLLTWLTNLLNW